MRVLAFVLLLLTAPSLAAPASASPVSEVEEAAIRAVVQGQLDAFQRDDDQAAFGFASPMIQDLFRTAEGFMAMVREGYAPVYRPRVVAFQDIILYRGKPTQLVYLVGPDGRGVLAHYLMVRQADGTWRIDGCILQPLPEASA